MVSTRIWCAAINVIYCIAPPPIPLNNQIQYSGSIGTANSWTQSNAHTTSTQLHNGNDRSFITPVATPISTTASSNIANAYRAPASSTSGQSRPSNGPSTTSYSQQTNPFPHTNPGTLNQFIHQQALPVATTLRSPTPLLVRPLNAIPVTPGATYTSLSTTVPPLQNIPFVLRPQPRQNGTGLHTTKMTTPSPLLVTQLLRQTAMVHTSTTSAPSVAPQLASATYMRAQDLRPLSDSAVVSDPLQASHVPMTMLPPQGAPQLIPIQQSQIAIQSASPAGLVQGPIYQQQAGPLVPPGDSQSQTMSQQPQAAAQQQPQILQSQSFAHPQETSAEPQEEVLPQQSLAAMSRISGMAQPAGTPAQEEPLQAPTEAPQLVKTYTNTTEEKIKSALIANAERERTRLNPKIKLFPSDFEDDEDIGEDEVKSLLDTFWLDGDAKPEMKSDQDLAQAARWERLNGFSRGSAGMLPAAYFDEPQQTLTVDSEHRQVPSIYKPYVLTDEELLAQPAMNLSVYRRFPNEILLYCYPFTPTDILERCLPGMVAMRATGVYLPMISEMQTEREQSYYEMIKQLKRNTREGQPTYKVYGVAYDNPNWSLLTQVVMKYPVFDGIMLEWIGRRACIWNINKPTQGQIQTITERAGPINYFFRMQDCEEEMMYQSDIGVAFVNPNSGVDMSDLSVVPGQFPKFMTPVFPCFQGQEGPCFNAFRYHKEAACDSSRQRFAFSPYEVLGNLMMHFANETCHGLPSHDLYSVV